MGGKYKQANRIKNNARPSSSSHSAELLGNTIPTFFGFTSSKNGMPSVPGFQVEEKSISINSDFQVFFKQMSKKDPITRFKALQMFTDAINNGDIETVKEVLPLWPRIYCSLCTDVDHKVREMSHKAHKAIVSKVKKMIAPYLKELAGPWFTSQYDTYAPAASAATMSFEEAFPSSKLNKAILFCQEEILSYIYDNLIIQTPQSLCSPIATSVEDLQAKYERLVLASLQGYSLYLQKLSEEEVREATECNKKIISHPKFWKYAKNKVALIRSCFFRTLIAICQNAKFLLIGETTNLCPAIFNNLEESEPIVLQPLWDAALNVLVTIEDCWVHINVEKQLLTKLCSILKTGGRNVFTIYPNILLLLSKVPVNTLTSKESFYEKLLDNMISGMEINAIGQSVSEGRVMANTFIECLKFIILQNLNNVEFCSSLISNQLMSAIEKLSVHKIKGIVKLPLLVQTVNLVYCWQSNIEKENLVYRNLISVFFESLILLFKKQLKPESSTSLIKDVLDFQIQFLSVLRNPNDFTSKSKCHVTFDDHNKCGPITFIEKNFNEVECSEELDQFIKEIVIVYFKNAIEKLNNSYIITICKVISIFNAQMVFEQMVIAVNESTCFKLFSSYFSKWLMDENMKCEELVRLSFTLLQFVTEDEKEYILEEFCGSWLSDSLHISVCKILPNYFKYDCVIKWVRGENFSANILSLIARFIDDDSQNMDWLNNVVTLLIAKFDKDFIMSASVIESIMNILTKKLEDPKEKPNALELTKKVILHAETQQIYQPSFSTLVACLFKLSCYKKSPEILIACETGLHKLILAGKCLNSDFNFTNELAKVVKSIILSNSIKYSLKDVMDRIKIYMDLVENINVKDISCFNLELKPVKQSYLEIVEKFLIREEKNCFWYEESIKMMEKSCHVGYQGNDSLMFEYLEKEKYTNFDGHESFSGWEKYSVFNYDIIQKYIKWNLYVGSLLNLLFIGKKLTIIPSDWDVSSTAMAPVVLTDKGGCLNSDSVSSLEMSKFSEDSQIHECVKALSKESMENDKVKEVIKDIYDFLLSVIYLEYLVNYYSCAKYYQSLRSLATELKSVASNLLNNFNCLQFQFIYDHCKCFFEKRSIWFIVKPMYYEIFKKKCSNLKNHESKEMLNTLDNSFEKFQNIEISNLSIHQGYYLMVLCFLQNKYEHRITEEQWDGIFIYIHKFYEKIFEKNQILERDILILSIVSRLYVKLRNMFKNCNTEENEKIILPEVSSVWNEVVQKEIHNKIILVWKKLATDWSNKKDIPLHWTVALQNISDAVLVDLLPERMETAKECINSVVEYSRLIMSCHAVIQITSFQICISLISDLIKRDTEMFGNNMSKMFQNEKEGSLSSKNLSNDNWSIKILNKDLLENQGIVEILLSDFCVGDNCTIEPFTDSFTYTYSYLLLWYFILSICKQAHSSLCIQYGSWLQKSGFTYVLLDSIFKLMPQTVLHGSKYIEEYKNYFEENTLLNLRKPIESKIIEQLACLIYRLLLQRLPNYVREWWKQAENKTSILVDNVTKQYVSPILILNELKNIQIDRDNDLENIEIKTFPNSREVIATYTIDEIKMNLNITLPPNYPLGTAKIESSNVVVGTSKWRNLLFQICKYLVHQNGTIWDALIIWKSNLDKKFEGVEECYICFSILQGSSFEIPRLCCNTCKKKFHSNCLYKWFSTSNNSTCPICRNLY